MSFLKSLFRSRDRPENAASSQNFGLLSRWPWLGGGTSAGKAVNERTAMQTSAVYACVRVLAESLAGLPLHVYERTEDGGKMLKINHPLYSLLHDEPNSEMTSFIFRETLMSHLLLYGNAFAQVVRNGRGYPIAIYPLLPDRVTVERNAKGEIIYTYNSDKQGEVKLRKGEILHIPGLGFDGLIGYSPIQMAKDAIGMTLAAEEYGSKFFANGATPGGILEHPSTIKDIQRVKDSWNAEYRGPGNANKVAILEEGMTFKAVTIAPEQAQFLESRKFQIAEIARIFRVPLHMIGDLEKSSFSNITQQSLEFVMYTLNPWVRRWEDSLQSALLLPGEKARILLRFNVDGLLRGDYKSRMDGYAVGRQNGWLSANDIRSLEKLNLIPAEQGGDLLLVNGNLMPLASRMEAGNTALTGEEENSNEQEQD